MGVNSTKNEGRKERKNLRTGKPIDVPIIDELINVAKLCLLERSLSEVDFKSN